jgi:hypothetical protein
MSNTQIRRNTKQPETMRSTASRQRIVREPLRSTGTKRAPLVAAGSVNTRVDAQPVSGTIDITDQGIERDQHAQADVNVVRALMFAQGLDERGRRLPLASDFMSEDELRPNHIMAQRQNATQRPPEFDAIYRRADDFGDGKPNVHSVTRLTRTVRLASNEKIGKESALTFSPGEAPLHLVKSRVSTMPSATGRVAPAVPSRTTALRSTESRPNRGSDARSESQNQSSSIGALALALAPVFSGDAAPAASPTRAKLQAVATRQRPWNIYGVALFWTAFIITFLFAAVVMHAGLASHQVSLDKMNTELDRSAALNNRLSVEVAGLQSPQRIAERASHLGLVNPNSVRFVKAVPAPTVTATGVAVNVAVDVAVDAVAPGQTGK